LFGDSLATLRRVTNRDADELDRSRRGVEQGLLAFGVVQEFDEGAADVTRPNDPDSNDRLVHL
jgi:hypothetical protein